MQTTSLPMNPIESVDHQHALTDVVKIEAKLLEKLDQKSMQDAKKNIIRCNYISWLIIKECIPRLEDYTVVNGISTLNFNPGDFYMASRH